MKLNQITTTILLFLLLPIGLEAMIFESSLPEAKRRAAAEGKLVMIEFSAKWCVPCKMMEKHTFSDNVVQEHLRKSYIPVKIDIDDFDGYAHKQVYNVNAIPTIIILDSRGNKVLKHEQTMTATELRAELERYDTPGNKIITASAPSTTTTYPSHASSSSSAPTYEVPQEPTTTYTPETTTTPTYESAPVYTSPAPKPNPEPTPYEPSSPVYTRVEPTPAPSQPTTNSNTSTHSAPVYESAPRTEPVLTSEGLYELQVVRMDMQGFSVQGGAFSDQDNMILQVEQFQKGFPNQKILVHIAYRNGQKLFKILVGHFQNRTDADMFREQVISSGMRDVFVKDLASLEPSM